MSQTFRQYLEGKEQLREAIKKVPVTEIEYEIRKYCTIMVGESVEGGDSVSLKPKQRVTVRWNYENRLSPIPECVRINTEGLYVDDEEYSIFWSSDKLQKWLIRHAREGVNCGHKI